MDNGQMDIFDYEYGVLRRTLDILEMVKISNTTAYRDNIYWRMGFDAAERVIKTELERGEKKMTIDDAIKHCMDVAEKNEHDIEYYTIQNDLEWLKECEKDCKECAKEHRQLAEWLEELKAYREFADWLAKAVLEEDWVDSSDFNAEVICRKLTKLGKLKVVDNKYMEINADEDRT